MISKTLGNGVEKTYTGKTNDLIRRLGEHNCEKNRTSGAKYTQRYGRGWRYYAVIGPFSLNKHALQCEWHMQHPNRKKRQGRRPNVVNSFRRIEDLHAKITKKYNKLPQVKFNVWVGKKHGECISTPGLNVIVKENLETETIDEIMKEAVVITNLVD